MFRCDNRNSNRGQPVSKNVNRRVLQETALRHFLEVVRTGSVTAAAERLNVAPSAVSRHIAHLESELDTLLFERRSRGMVPNPAGELLAAHAKRAWQDIERVTDDIQALRGLQTGLVRIASTEGFASEFLPNLIAEFQREYKGIRFALNVHMQAEIPQLVRDGDVDIGVTLSTSSERQINVELRHPSPILAIMAKDHPLASRRQLALAQLVGYPMALPGPYSTLRQLFDISCSRQGLQCEPALLANRLDASISFAAAGGGIALSGEAALRNRLKAGGIVAVPLRDREMNERHFEIQTMAGRTLPGACRAFLDHLREVLRKEG
ncbi:LysR family transcriptional regulator [Variovorax saccharolyticus]|uniref:LysR family transcriptional regulator n=1 Tax=Variovorax saccharolyticus TaxID=3053516 RepID=UPI002576B1D2|nr:LysR family transcriptional regulator [Variovorax sp. J22R187]MDM0022082.1 LysR family transcriptional regulator [Variovorax sp. J22R187]